MSYQAPVEEIDFTLRHVVGVSDALAAGYFSELSDDLITAILSEAGRFATDEIAPLNAVADAHGTPLRDGVVTMPPGWKEAYDQWIAGGWSALTGPPEFGGQGLPVSLATATLEMWNSGSMAFGIGPTLTIGAVDALVEHASAQLKSVYVEKLVSGRWMATMNLTEPQAGSDLNALRTRAEPAADGSYRIFGQKIFITYGEHDLTENIIHLVLARLPDAPAGTRGISLFLVPKFLLEEDGSPGARNDVHCGGIEHKLGIHGSPTCTMLFGQNDGAVGWLVGEENRGLNCMFTMMNNARLAVGIQGVGIAERAYQHALAYARERRQGRAPGWQGEGMSPIVEHPDIRRELLAMKSLTQAVRAIAYSCGHAMDMAAATEGEIAEGWRQRADLLTPIAKAFSTDVGVEVANRGIQIHGGMGYVEETGAAQHLRDARIAPIYEGTNGIQAIDLVTRKLPMAGGEATRAYLRELAEIAETARTHNAPHFTEMAGCLATAIDDLRAASEHLLEMRGAGEMSQVLSVATPYLRLLGLTAGGAYLVSGAYKAATVDGAAALADTQSTLARYFCRHHLPETAALAACVTSGPSAVVEGGLAEFAV